jgi:hypothetical protein
MPQRFQRFTGVFCRFFGVVVGLQPKTEAVVVPKAREKRGAVSR